MFQYVNNVFKPLVKLKFYKLPINFNAFNYFFTFKLLELFFTSNYTMPQGRG